MEKGDFVFGVIATSSWNVLLNSNHIFLWNMCVCTWSSPFHMRCFQDIVTACRQHSEFPRALVSWTLWIKPCVRRFRGWRNSQAPMIKAVDRTNKSKVRFLTDDCLQKRLFVYGEGRFKGELEDRLKLSAQIHRACQHDGWCFLRSQNACNMYQS